MEPLVSLPCSQDPTIWPYPEPHKYTTCPQSYWSKIHFRLEMHTKCDLLNGKVRERLTWETKK
jgi:hypothetical protein